MEYTILFCLMVDIAGAIFFYHLTKRAFDVRTALDKFEVFLFNMCWPLLVVITVLMTLCKKVRR